MSPVRTARSRVDAVGQSAEIGDDKETFPNQLYIDPEECINCGVCEPECPWEAIFEDERVPEVFNEDIGLNAKIVDTKDTFEVPEVIIPRLTNRAGGRIEEEGSVIGFAVVVAGRPEAEWRPQDQERRRQRPPLGQQQGRVER